MAEQSCANGSECSSQKALADQLVQRTENGATADPHVPMASQTTTTNIMNITLTNVGQVIHVSGEHQVVNIPQPTVQMFQQAIGFNPTVGVSNNAQSFPSRSSHQCSDPSQPEGFETPTHDPPGSHRELPYASTFAEGPPGGIELVEVTQILMSKLGSDWIRLAPYLDFPDHERAATDDEEPTLYRRIHRMLKFWVESSENNDRKKLVSVLPSDVVAEVSDVLKKL